MRTRLLAALLAFQASVGVTSAATLRVPSEYATINAALDASGGSIGIFWGSVADTAAPQSLPEGPGRLFSDGREITQPIVLSGFDSDTLRANGVALVALPGPMVESPAMIAGTRSCADTLLEELGQAYGHKIGSGGWDLALALCDTSKCVAGADVREGCLHIRFQGSEVEEVLPAWSGTSSTYDDVRAATWRFFLEQVRWALASGGAVAFTELRREPVVLSPVQTRTLESWASEPSSIKDPKLKGFAEDWCDANR